MLTVGMQCAKNETPYCKPCYGKYFGTGGFGFGGVMSASTGSSSPSLFEFENTTLILCYIRRYEPSHCSWDASLQRRNGAREGLLFEASSIKIKTKKDRLITFFLSARPCHWWCCQLLETKPSSKHYTKGGHNDWNNHYQIRSFRFVFFKIRLSFFLCAFEPMRIIYQVERQSVQSVVRASITLRRWPHWIRTGIDRVSNAKVRITSASWSRGEQTTDRSTCKTFEWNVECGKPLSAGQFCEGNGLPYCQTDYNKLFRVSLLSLFFSPFVFFCAIAFFANYLDTTGGWIWVWRCCQRSWSILNVKTMAFGVRTRTSNPRLRRKKEACNVWNSKR